MRVLKALAFLFMLHLAYLSYSDVINPSHYGNAVTRAYEMGNKKKLEALRCKVYDPNDKNISVREGFIYQMKDGKKVACNWERWG
jgi:hypothetical protein